MQLVTHALGRLENADTVYTCNNAYSWLVSIAIRFPFPEAQLINSSGNEPKLIINVPYLVCWLLICLFVCVMLHCISGKGGANYRSSLGNAPSSALN